MQLKVGGKYKDRGGAIVEIKRQLEPYEDNYKRGYRFIDTAGITYTKDGKFHADIRNSYYDLIEEITPQPTMKYQTGKYYHDSNGNERLVVSTTSQINLRDNVDKQIKAFPVISERTSDGDLLHHTIDGYSVSHITNLLDEVVEFKFDWSCLPAWAKEIATDKYNNWRWTAGTFTLQDSYWLANHERAGVIPTEYHPAFNGDWKDSRRVRPTTPQ